MRTKTIAIAASGALLAALAAGAGATAAAALDSQHASAASHATPYYLSCGVLTPRRPKDAQLDCRYPGHQLTRLSWRSWDAGTAHGLGQLAVGAAHGTSDTRSTYFVDVELGSPKQTRNGLAFTKMTVQFKRQRPKGAPREIHIPLTGVQLAPVHRS